MNKIPKLWATWKGPAAAAFSVISAVAAGSLFLSEKLSTLERVEEKLSARDGSLTRVADEIRHLRGQVQELEVRLSESSTRGMTEEKVHEQQERTLSRLADDLAEIKADLARADAILEILKPLVTEGLAFGRISLDDVKRVYTPEEIGEFLKDAEKLFAPEGGGGGGGGSDLRVAKGSYNTASQHCVGPPRNCAFVSFKLPADDSAAPRIARIELHYNLTEEEVAFLLPSEGTEASERLRKIRASAREFGGSLCAWIYERFPHRDEPNPAAEPGGLAAG